jgi:hypothetical protein
MKDWPPLHADADAELERADDLLDQADALLSRHRMPTEAQALARPMTRPHPDVSGHDALAYCDNPLADDDDLPILTEIVDELELPPERTEQAARPLPPLSATAALTASVSTAFSASPIAEPSPPSTPGAPSATARMSTEDRITYQIAERLVELDTQIARSINEWMDKELPQLLQRQLEHLSEQLQTEMQAHLRATLLPELSAHISAQLELTPATTPPPAKR